MRLVIAGGTGFIGSALCVRLLELGHSLTILSRTRSSGPILSNKDWITWQPGSPGPWEEAIDGVDGVINLAGSVIDIDTAVSRKGHFQKGGNQPAVAAVVSAADQLFPDQLLHDIKGSDEALRVLEVGRLISHLLEDCRQG